MHDALDSGLVSGFLRFTSCDKDVLAIPGFDSRIIPDLPSQFVGAGEIELIKELLPVVRPLTMEVIFAGLLWRGGGEQDGVAQPGELAYEIPRRSGFKVLRDFEAEAGLEPLIDSPFLLFQVDMPEILLGDQELARRNIYPIDPKDLWHLHLSSARCPGSLAASHIKEAGGDLRTEKMV